MTDITRASDRAPEQQLTATPHRNKPPRPVEFKSGQQVRMFRSSPVGVESTLVGEATFDAHLAEGWSLQDPAFTPDDDVVGLAQESADGLVPMHSKFFNPAGNTKRVKPDEVGLYEQTGWSVSS